MDANEEAALAFADASNYQNCTRLNREADVEVVLSMTKGDVLGTYRKLRGEHSSDYSLNTVLEKDIKTKK